MILEPLKILSESWKSPENLFLKKGTNPVFRMQQQFYFLIFMGEVIPKRGEDKGGEKSL